jgi:5-(carboxyamino)imidazole ribonucleotide mutase
VATVALNASKNAGILAVQMIAIHDSALSAKLDQYKVELIEKVAEMSTKTKDLK